VLCWVGWCPNVKLVGQFNDDVVVEWFPLPGRPDLPQTMKAMNTYMTETHLPGFPLDAEIKSDHRYTK